MRDGLLVVVLVGVQYLDVVCLVLAGLLGVVATLAVLLDFLLLLLLLLCDLDVVQCLSALARQLIEVGSAIVQAEVLLDHCELVGGGP